MELSDHAKELLADLTMADPWAQLGNVEARVTQAYKEIAGEVGDPTNDPVTARSPEDVVNYVAAEVMGWFIVMMDLLDCHPDDALDSIRWQYEVLAEGQDVQDAQPIVYKPKHMVKP